MVFLHISDRSEIALMSISILFVYTFLKREVIIISLWIENTVVLDL